MLLRRLTHSLTTSGGLVLVAGVAAVLVALNRYRQGNSGRQVADRSAAPVPAETRRDYFEIRRTHSEVGFTYWTLRGHGIFECFELFDTWAEAMSEAAARSQRVAV